MGGRDGLPHVVDGVARENVLHVLHGGAVHVDHTWRGGGHVPVLCDLGGRHGALCGSAPPSHTEKFKFNLRIAEGKITTRMSSIGATLQFEIIKLEFRLQSAGPRRRLVSWTLLSRKVLYGLTDSI
jgi:hypothetical protein